MAVEPHRYWRINSSAEDGPEGYISFSDIQFRANKGYPQEATGGVAFSSGDYGGYPAANAFDGNDNTSWISNGVLPSQIGYDFGAPVDCVQVLLRNRADGYYYQAPKSFTVEWSDDGANWTVEWAEDNVAWNSTLQTMLFENPNAPDTPTAILASGLLATVPLSPPTAASASASGLSAVVPMALPEAVPVIEASGLSAVVPIGLAPAMALRLSGLALVVPVYEPGYVPPPTVRRLPCQSYCLPLYYAKEYV